jgi:predicted nucleic acid-binding protein
MKIVVDTNIIFSALLSRDAKLKQFFFIKGFEFFSCNFLFIEIFRHKNKLIAISKLSEEEILTGLEKLLGRISFVREELIPESIFNKAYLLCKDIDEKDTPFVALTLFLDAHLWTGDKKLKEGLKGKGFHKFFEPSNPKSLSRNQP